MIYTVKNITFSSNTYILENEQKKTCVIIDAGLDNDIIDQKIQELNLQPIAIFATHGHFDHIGSVAFLKEKYNIPFYIHKADEKLISSVNFYLKLLKIPKSLKVIKPDYLFTQKIENISINGFEFTIYNFPGHSPGSCIIKYNNNLFTGDIIYKSGLGFNHFPGENKETLKQSILEMIRIFPKKSLIYPGHGESDTINNILKNNLALINFLPLISI